MTGHPDQWPLLSYDAVAPTVDHLNRLVQIAGKYTLDQAFEPGWGNIVYGVTPRGLTTPTHRRTAGAFAVHYRLLDGDVIIEASSGFRVLALRTQSVADFYADFLMATAELGLPAPGSVVASEIPDAEPLDADDRPREWDPAAARLIWTTLNSTAGALEEWQASYRGYRPRVGVMWGGFDLSATRYRARATTPPPNRPAFMQHGMSEEYVAVGFSFGTPEAPAAAIYAYIAPQPAGLEDCSWGADGAAWLPEQGLAVLPWEAVRTSVDPHRTILVFADAVYAAAVKTAGWPADLVGPRYDGWHASRTPPSPSPETVNRRKDVVLPLSPTAIDPSVAPSGTGCVECLAGEGPGWWLHLRRCARCGHIGCCDNSPSRHAAAHNRATGHPVLQSFEPGEDWFFDFRTREFFDGPTLAAPRSHPGEQPVPGPAGAVPADWQRHLH